MAVYSRKDIESSKENLISFLSRTVEKNSFLFCDQKTVNVKSQIQALLKTQVFDDLSKIILEIILENAYKSEQLAPGAFKKTIENLSHLNDPCTESYHAKREDIENFVKRNLSDVDSDILMSAIDLVGFSGKITLEKSINDSTSIEVIDSFIFSIDSYLTSNVKLINPKIILIDGYVESVSEINRLLESMTNTGYQLIFLARGFDAEVINTICVNNDRKVFSIYPIQVPFDIEGLNALVDMSIASGCELISSNLGQLISTVDVSIASTLDEASITKNKISFKKRSTNHNVRIQIKNLLKKIAENPQTSEIYEKRIASLNSNNVVIKLPDNSNFVSRSQSIDHCLRSVRSMMDYGMSNSSECFATNHIAKHFAKSTLSILENLEFVLRNSN